MYRRIDKHTGELRHEFISGVEDFDKFARSHQEFLGNHVYRCSYTKRKNAEYLTPDDVKLHFCIEKVLSRITGTGQVTERL